MKKITLVLMAAIALSACDTDSKVASRNLSKAADMFEIDRRIVFYNGITDQYILTIEGKKGCEMTDLFTQPLPNPLPCPFCGSSNIYPFRMSSTYIWVAPPTLGVPFIIGTTFNVDYQNTLQQRPANSHDVLRKKNIDIPRYDMGIQYIKTSASEGYGVPAIIQSNDGEYVKLDDYIELLNAFNQYVSRTHKEIA